MAKRTGTAAAKTTKRDLYQEVTDRIIVALEAGTVPWRQPWKSGVNSNPLASRNALTGRAYSGVNVLILASSSWSAIDNRWLTFKQALEAGGAVRKGEKGTMIVFWKPLLVADKADAEKTKAIMMLRAYTVFSVAQCDGLDESKLKGTQSEPPVAEFDAIASREAIVDGYAGKPRIGHGGSRAFYSPSIDAIQIPERAAFDQAERYYGVLFHEMTHSTGHADRLGRLKGATTAKFGDAVYSQEELVAELGSAFLCARVGIEDTTLDNSASYIAGWMKELKNDPRMIVMAAAQANKAAEHIAPTATGEGK